MATPLTSVSGIGPAAAAVLGEHGFASAEQLAASVVDDLVKVPGFGQARAATTLRAARSLIEGGANPAAADGGAVKTGKQKAKRKEKNKGDKKDKKKASQSKQRKDGKGKKPSKPKKTKKAKKPKKGAKRKNKKK